MIRKALSKCCTPEKRDRSACQIWKNGCDFWSEGSTETIVLICLRKEGVTGGFFLTSEVETVVTAEKVPSDLQDLRENRVPLGFLEYPVHQECRESQVHQDVKERQESLVLTSQFQALPVLKETQVLSGVLGQRDLVGPRGIQEKTEPGSLVSNMFTGEKPHVPTILRWFMKVLLEVAITPILVEEENTSAYQMSQSTTSTRTGFSQAHTFMALNMKSAHIVLLRRKFTITTSHVLCVTSSHVPPS